MDSTIYLVKLELLEPMLGTVPKNKDVYSRFIADKLVDEGLKEEEVATVQEIEDRAYTGFHRDEKGNFVYDYFIKGFLCESARTLKQYGLVKQLQDKFKRYVFVAPRRVRLPEATSTCERPLRAQTAQGPRVALAKSDTVPEGTQLTFNLEVLDNGSVTQNCLIEVLSYGKHMGFGQWRSGGYGRFKIVSLEQVKELMEANPANDVQRIEEKKPRKSGIVITEYDERDL